MSYIDVLLIREGRTKLKSLLGLLLLDLYHISHSDLRSVVDNVLIVLQMHHSLLLWVTLAVVDDLAIRNLDSVRQNNSVLVAWSSLSTSFDTVIRMLKLLDVLCLVEFL